MEARRGGPHLSVQSQQRHSREYWPIPEFPSESTACVVYEIQSGSTPERDLFELVKKHSKRSGVPIDIQLESTTEPGWKKARVHYYRLDTDGLKADKSLILGRPPKFRVYYPTSGEQKHPQCHPSTSYAIPKLKGDHLLKASCSVHVPHLDRHSPDHYRRRFESYGQVIDVDMVKSNDNKAFAVVQFTNIDDAQKALQDTNIPKPMSYQSRPSHRIIIFYLPIECTNEEIMLIIRSLSDRIVDICVDWWDRSAVITLDDMEPANLLLKRMKLVGRNNFGEHKVAVDFCSDRFNLYFINRKKENIEVAARSSSPTSKSENDQGSSSPSSSRDRQNLHDPLQTRSSVEHHTNQEDQENNASGSDSSSDSDSEEGSSSSNEDSDEQNDVDEEDDEDVVSEEKRHEPEEGKSSSPGNGHRDESNGDKDHEDSSERFSQPSTSSHHETSHSPEKDSEAYQSRSFSPLNYQSQSPGYEFLESKEIKQEFSPTTSSASSSDLELDMEMPDNPLTRMLERMHWRPFIDVSSFVNRIDEIVELNQKARASYEKFTGRPFPKCNNDEVLSIQKIVFHEPRDYYYYENPCSELEVRIRDWRKLSDTADLDDFRATDSKELGRDQPAGGRTSGRPSLDESRTNRLSFDSTHHPAELAQRSHSLCIGPMTPSTPFPTSQPLLVNTTHLPGTSQPSTSGGITTPRSSQPPPLMSPVSRHNSMSSTGRPASIQTLRHQSVMFPPDVSIPPPPIPPTHDEMMAPRGTPPSRRSSETMVPLRSPPFGTPIQNLLTMPIVPPPHLIAATSTGTHSVSSSAHSTPRHSISGTPVHCEPSNSKTSQPPTPKSRPEKVQIRHDTISKSGPSNAINALQARSQSMTSGDPKKSAPSTPVVRDAGSDLVAQIMSNQPNLGLRKLPRIEKKSSALQNIQNHQPPHSNANSTPSTPSTSTHQAMFKDKEKERKKKEKEKEEREREARREMKRKETKEERNKRKEMERAKRLEDERQERKREKKKERDERKKEKEKVRKKAEKEKLKKKKHRKGDSSDESDSDSNDELDLDVRKSTKEMTQEEKDHQLALLLSKGGIIENLKSRRRSDKRAHDSFEKMQQKSQQRRVLIESSDDEGGKDGDKGNSSNGEESDSEKADLPPPPAPPSLSESADQRLKVLKEREKGELTTSSDDEDHNDAGEIHQQRLTEDRENRKRQKSLTAYSSDEQGERKNVPKRMRRDDSEDAAAKHPGWSAKDDQKQRKRKLEHRRSSEDESKKNAKRDFRDIPHEDVSDEEETEDGSRSRRQSTSSTISNVTAKERKEKSGKTPLRIVPEPTGTPLLSPKILSPKHLSPKTSTSSTKRSSISDHENLISPRQRNRTTSSTSTATTSSKHEALSIPEKPLSPPVTAKSSVSSIDDPSIRDEFSMNSAADSPMSTTGRPMVLTKAAMKAFNSTPPKKKNSSSGQHDSSSGSSSDSSSSDGSTSSDDSSDDEVPKQTEPVTSIPVVASDNGSPENVVVETPSIVSQTPREPEPFTISEQSSESEPEAVPECPEASVEPQMETSQNVEPVSEEHEDSHEHGDSEVAVESQQQPLEHQEEKEELENKILDVAAEHHEEQVQGDEDSVESSIPAPSDEPDPVTQAQEKSAHTLISDQETDQAVQSIFDEEEADEFPQYPDFGISTNEKEVSGKDPHNIKPTEPLNNGHTDLLFSPSSSAHASEKQSTKSEDDMEEDSELVVMEKEVPMEQVIAQEVHVPSEPSPMEEEVKLETSPVPKEEPIKMEESPEQTPTPDLISNNESQDTPGAVNNHLHENHDAVQTPIQLQPASQHQVAQPSPRPAVAPDSQQNGPVLVSQQSQPSPMSSQQSDMAQNLILSSKDINDLAAKLHKNPEALAQATRGDCSGIFQHLLLHAQGNGQNMTPEMLQLKAAFFAQQQENEANQMMQAKMKQQTINKDRIKEQERVKRMYEENERKVEEDRREKQRKEEERQRLAAATAAATMATQKAAEALKQKQEVPRHGFQHVLSMMTPEARSLYEQFPGLSSYINRDSIGATNGVLHLPTQSIQRPSSTASTSSNPPKAPLQPSASVNQNTIDPAEIEEIRVQRWFYKHFPMVWTGRLALKSTEAMINLHLINGSETFLNDVLGRQVTEENPRRDSVKILQRLRLDNGQVEHIYRILTNPEYACCLALSSVNNIENLKENDTNLKSHFIDYLINKKIAGISSLGEVETKFKSARVHVFAPGEIVNRYLSELATSLHDYLQNTDTRYLLIVFTNDKADPNMTGPPSVASLAVPPVSST